MNHSIVSECDYLDDMTFRDSMPMVVEYVRAPECSAAGKQHRTPSEHDRRIAPPNRRQKRMLRIRRTPSGIRKTVKSHR